MGSNPRDRIAPGYTLGNTLRGMRHGYRWVPTIGAYLRISDEGDGFRIRINPGGEHWPSARGRSPVHDDLFRCWWEGRSIADDLAASVLAVIAGPAASSARVRAPITFYMDDNGRYAGP